MQAFKQQLNGYWAVFSAAGEVGDKRRNANTLLGAKCLLFKVLNYSAQGATQLESSIMVGEMTCARLK